MGINVNTVSPFFYVVKSLQRVKMESQSDKTIQLYNTWRDKHRYQPLKLKSVLGNKKSQ